MSDSKELTFWEHLDELRKVLIRVLCLWFVLGVVYFAAMPYLFDKVVMPIMTKVCGMLIREREAEIRRQAVHSTQMRNELSCYSHSVQDIEQMLKKNVGYVFSLPFGKMKEDMERFLSKNEESGQPKSDEAAKEA